MYLPYFFIRHAGLDPASSIIKCRHRRRIVTLDSRLHGNGTGVMATSRHRTTPTKVGVQLILCRLKGDSLSNVGLMIDPVGIVTLWAGDIYEALSYHCRNSLDRWGQSKIAVIGVDGRIGGDFTLTP